MPIADTDERPHHDGAERWGLVATGSDDVALRVLVETRAVGARLSLLLLRPSRGPVVVRDEVHVRGEPFELRGDGVWMHHWCETPFEHWSYGLEAFGVELDRPQDAWAGERGRRVAIGWDLGWEATGAPFAFGSGYVQPGVVAGELLLDDATLHFVGHGLRSHVWGATVVTPGLWWRDDRGDVYVSGDRAVRWSSDTPAMVDLRGYDSLVDTRGFPTRVDVTLGADTVSVGIEPYAWAGEITGEDPLVVAPHAAVQVRRDGALVGSGWQEGVAAST